MSAAFGKFLVFDMTTGQTCSFEFADCARHIFRTSKTSVGIDNRRNFHRTGDVARQVRHFANVAGMGVSGVVSRRVNHGLRWPTGKAAFMLATARALVTWTDQPVRWRVDGGPWHEERLTALSVCNGRYFGGGGGHFGRGGAHSGGGHGGHR